MPANPETLRQAWFTTCAALARFVAEHGRAPKQRETQLVDGREVAVGRWLMHQHQRGTLDDEQQQALADALAGHPVRRDDAWWQRHSEVSAYVAETGRQPVKGTVWHGAPIGQWSSDQRKAYHRGTLAPDRVAALEEIPGWDWSPDDTEFEVGLTHFCDFHAEHGTGWVPVRYVCADGFPLGAWHRERRRHRHSDSPERQSRLLVAGFVYETPAPADRPRIRSRTAPRPESPHARGSAAAWDRRRGKRRR